jgi:hypothetical protein
VPVLAEAAALGRSVAFAWAIGPDELGRAMMLALTVRLVEMASDVGADRLMLQAATGTRARLQADLHGALLLRGLIGAACCSRSRRFSPPLRGRPGRRRPMRLAASRSCAASPSRLPAGRAAVPLRPMAVVEGGATLAMAACILPAARCSAITGRCSAC